VAGSMNRWDTIYSALSSNARAARLIAIILASAIVTAIPAVVTALLVHH
jgi:hypothetical protein